MASAQEIRKLARETLGIEKLRPGQLQAIEAVQVGGLVDINSTGPAKSRV